VAVSLRPFGRRGDRPRPPVTDDGRMTLVEHLRELRSRLFKSILAIFIGTCVGWWQYGRLFDLLIKPFNTSIKALAAERDIHASPVFTGIADAFMLQTKVSLVGGLVLSSPVWLYQIWAFIVPGLHRHERRWTLVFVAIAGPLFATGVVLGYYVLPKGLEILIGFTPGQVQNLIEVDRYLSFVLRILLVFGVAFEIPLFVILLNLAHVVSSRQLARWRSYIIFGTFVFAAVATPSTDPITMLFLALPMTALFLVAEVITRIVEARRRGGEDDTDYEDLDDEEPSAIRLDETDS
jgi:sec-independent protein translocase protein TatC